MTSPDRPEQWPDAQAPYQGYRPGPQYPPPGRSDDRGYREQGYHDQGYSQQGYSQQGYSQRPYRDEGYHPQHHQPQQPYRGPEPEPRQQYESWQPENQQYAAPQYGSRQYAAPQYRPERFRPEPYGPEQYGNQQYPAGYPMPGMPQPGYSQGPAHPPPKRMSKGLKTLLWSVGVVVVVACLGVSTLVVIGAIAKQHGITAGGEPPVKLDVFTLPKTFQGMSQTNDPNLRKLAADTVKDLSDDGPSTAAYYLDPLHPEYAFAAFTVSLDNPDPTDFATGVLDGFTNGSTVTSKKSYPVGAGGGVMICAQTKDPDGLIMSACALADIGGALMTLYAGHTAATLAADTVLFRAQAESHH